MDLIVISYPESLQGEAEMMNALFKKGLPCLHLRKPGYSEEQLADLLSAIGPEWHGRISLHQHHGLAERFGIRRLHFTETARNAVSAQQLELLLTSGFVLSTSIHSQEALRSLPACFRYVFLGPVFDSISKEGYQAALPADFKLDRSGFPGKVIALGGIRLSNLKTVAEMGFDGAALLGSIWQNPDQSLAPGLPPGASDWEFDGSPNRAIHRLHFISQETAALSHIDSIRLALDAGCRWIQLRVKNRQEEEVLPLAWEATRLCDAYGAKLIINDFPRVARAVEAHGLHLGLTDMSVPEARKLVGDSMIIGGTANTWEHMALRIEESADYIGLGPFRFTSTKQNLSPVLGEAGYHTLMRQMADAGQSVPVIAIGGILPSDIHTLRATGIHGVAMSAALIGADDRKKTVYQIHQALC